jgi:hypothetical protein
LPSAAKPKPQAKAPTASAVEPQPPTPTPTPTPTPAPTPPVAADTPRSAIRDALSNFGYQHISLADIKAPDSPTPLDLAALQVRLAGLDRFHNDCFHAAKLWQVALTQLAALDDSAEVRQWVTSAQLGIALCDVTNGNYARAIAQLVNIVAATDGMERREALFAQAVALWQINRIDDSQQAMATAMLTRDPRDPIRAAFARIVEPLHYTPPKR